MNIINILPWILILVAVLILLFFSHIRKTTYLFEGFLLGTCLILLMSYILEFSHILGLSLGMIVGEAIGCLKQKRL